MLLMNENFDGFNRDNLEDLFHEVQEEKTTAEKLNEIYFWSFNMEEKDFFLNHTSTWFNISAEGYQIRVEGETCWIPGIYYIIIGELEIGFDIISPEEIVGREFSALLFEENLNLSKKIFENFQIVGYQEQMDFIFPLTNNLIPVKVGRKAVLISYKNVYSRLKKLTFVDFL